MLFLAHEQGCLSDLLQLAGGQWFEDQYDEVVRIADSHGWNLEAIHNDERTPARYRKVIDAWYWESHGKGTAYRIAKERTAERCRKLLYGSDLDTLGLPERVEGENRDIVKLLNGEFDGLSVNQCLQAENRLKELIAN